MYLPKIQALIDRAVHPCTPIEEARTTAMIAVSLLRKQGIILTMPGQAQDNARAADPAPPPSDSQKVQDGPIPCPQARKGYRGRRVMRTKYSGTCKHCNLGYEIGDLISWAPGQPVYHARCA